MNKTAKVLLIIAGASSLTLIVLYFTVFHAGFSTDSSDWGNFGSYVGGIISPILSFATIVFLIFQNRDQRKQFEEEIALQKKNTEKLKTEQECRQIEAAISNLIDRLMEPINKQIPGTRMIELYKIMYPGFTFTIQPDRNETTGEDENGTHIKIADSSIFNRLTESINEIGPEKTYDLFITKNEFLLKNEIITFNFLCEYLAGLVLKLDNNGYSKYTLKYYLSIIYPIYEILSVLGIANKEYFIIVKLFQELPIKGPNFSTSIDGLKEGIVDELNQSIFVNKKINNTNEIIIDKKSFALMGRDLVLTIEYKGNKYSKIQGEWVKQS